MRTPPVRAREAPRVELVGADHAAEDLLEGARAQARLARGLLGDAPRGRLGQLELEPEGGEVGLGLLQARLGHLLEDPQQLRLPQVLEQHQGVEAREELRAHPVLEQVLVLQPVAQDERQLLAHLPPLHHRDRLQGPLVAPRGHPMEDRVVEPFEGARAHEEQPARVDVDGAAPRPVGQGEGHRLVLDEGEQGLLGPDAGYVHLAAHVASDLVHLVHEHEAVARLVHQALHRASRVRAAAAPAPAGAAAAPRPGARARPPRPRTLAWMRITVERRARAGFWASTASTARMRVVLPEPEEPIIRMLPTRSLASFLARPTEISRMASFWPITRRSSRAAICGGDGVLAATRRF